MPISISFFSDDDFKVKRKIILNDGENLNEVIKYLIENTASDLEIEKI